MWFMLTLRVEEVVLVGPLCLGSACFPPTVVVMLNELEVVFSPP